jgi:M6 family metalloprotease-like protein
MRAAAVLLLCLLMVSGAVVVVAQEGGLPRPRGTENTGQVSACPVPAAPWSGNHNSDPFIGLDHSRHPPVNSPASAITGTAKVLVILINFADVTNTSAHTPKYFNDLLLNASTNSMNKFYKDNSYNLFCVTGNVTTKFYTAPKNEAWYGTYEMNFPPISGYGNSGNLTYDALNAADTDINFSEFDQDSDGDVDHLIIVHSGLDDANDGDFTGWSGDPQMWSHAVRGINFGKTWDGKNVDSYIILSEYSPVGTFVHEFGHDIGLPDLYNTITGGDGGVGDWDVMATGSWNGGGNTPAHLSVWCKMQLGWLTPFLLTVDTAGINTKRVEDNTTGAVYKVWVNFSNNESFLVENRQQVGWDAGLPGSGLLIWHINDTATSNKNDNYRWVDLEEWDNDNDAQEANDAWRSNITGFTPTSAPNTNDYAGRSTGIRIFNISASGNTMIFDLALSNVAPNAPVPSSPADSAWTGLSRPVLSWTFSDNNGGDSQMGYTVQVDDDSGFGLPNWTSGDVSSATPSCTVGSALAEGRWYWRVRTRDSGGLWGPYNSATVRSVRIDLTPPAAPVGPASTPSSWSPINLFSVDWTMPSEGGTSGIATGAYYKLDSVPMGPTDGTWASSKPVSGIVVSGSGTHTMYLWLLDNVGNVNHINRASVTLYFDNAAPLNPASLTSSTHSVSTWSNLSVIQVQWSGASDAHSGLDGFSYIWDGSPSTVPDALKDCEETAASTSSLPLSDGVYYFHMRTVDNVGNWAITAAHVGPFWIDGSPPKGVDGATSSSHQTSVWSNLNVISAAWSGASDGMGSGVGGYSIAWDNNPGTIPDDTTDVTSASAASPPLADGAGYYFHVRARDAVFNWNASAFHLGPFNIDTIPPDNPTGFSVRTNNAVDVWSSNRVISVEWSGFSDALSGVDVFSVIWDDSPLTIPGTVKWLEEDRPWSTSQILPTGEYYLHIRTKDNAGNWNAGALHIGPFKVDADRPSAVAVSDEGSYSSSSELNWSWSAAADGQSSVAGYIISVGTSAGADDVLRNGWTDATAFTLTGAQDGRRYYLRVMAVDRAGNKGEWGPSSDGITVDLSPPAGVRMSINGGAAATNSSSIEVRVVAYDAISGLGQMRFSQDGMAWTDWSAFLGSVNLEMVPGDGPKTVYCQVQDSVGNAAAPAQATIMLDTTGPVILGMRTLDGRHYTLTSSVLIELLAADACSGASQVRLSPDGKTWGSWSAWGQLFAWELAGPDGPKEVYAQAKDSLGNIGSAANMSLVLDTAAPAKPAVTSSTHPSNSVWYNSAMVSLQWTAPADASGIAGYSFIFSPFEADRPFEAMVTTSTGLSAPVPGEGRWHFRVMAVDLAGNWGDAADYVMLIDTAGPAPPALQTPSNNEQRLPGPVQLLWKAAGDGLSGVKGYQLQVANDGGYTSMVFDGVVDATSYSTGSLEQGDYFWHVRARDGAGNWGEYGASGVFTARRPVPETPQASAGLLDISNQLTLVMLGVILVAIIAGIAGAAMRKKKEPPEKVMPPEDGQMVRWE